MTEKLCLRCDWAGETKERACPSCGAGLFRAAGAPAPPPRHRAWRRSERRPPRPEPSLATPARESFDPATPDEPVEPTVVSRRGGWVIAALILCLAVAVGVFLERATPPAPSSAPAPGLQGDLVFASSESGGRSRLWIWNLETGAIRRGPTVRGPLELVDAYGADPQGGGVGVVSQEDGQQVAGLIRNFAVNDVPAPVLQGDLVAWGPEGDVVVSATKPPDRCSALRVESLYLGMGAPRVRLDRRMCGQLTGLGHDGLYAHVGLERGEQAWVARVREQIVRPWVRGVSLVAVAPNGGALVATGCQAPSPQPCGELAYADPSLPGSRHVHPYADEDVGPLLADRFLGWGHDGRTGFVLGTFGEIRGVYAVIPSRDRPKAPRLVIETLASEVYLAESYGIGGGELFISGDGQLLLISPDGDQVPLSLPEGVPSPDGPIVWVAAAGGA